MKGNLLTKIRNALTEPITRECEALYIMVEIRKVLDHLEKQDRLDKRYGTLRFYCDWAMHIRMSKESARILVSIVDQELDKPRGEPWEWDADMNAHSVFLFSRLGHDLRRFLNDHDLPSQIVDDPGVWRQFLTLYVAIVSDCPLTHQNVHKSFRHLASLTVRIGEPPGTLVEANPQIDYLCLEWDLLYKTGESRKMPALLGTGPGDHPTTPRH
jgi:hypothetical protein